MILTNVCTVCPRSSDPPEKNIVISGPNNPEIDTDTDISVVILKFCCGGGCSLAGGWGG